LKKRHYKTTQQLKQLNKQKNEQQFQAVGSKTRNNTTTQQHKKVEKTTLQNHTTIKTTQQTKK